MLGSRLVTLFFVSWHNAVRAYQIVADVKSMYQIPRFADCSEGDDLVKPGFVALPICSTHDPSLDSGTHQGNSLKDLRPT